MARSEELNARLVREMNERAAREQALRKEMQDRQRELDDPSQDSSQQLEQDQQAEQRRAQQASAQQQAQQQRDDLQNVQAAAVVDDDLSYDEPSYDDPTFDSHLEDEFDYDYDNDYDDFGGGGGAPVVAGGEQSWAAPTADSRREGRAAPGEPAGRQQNPDAGPDRRQGDRAGRAPGSGPEVRPGQDAPGQDTPGQDGPTRPPGTQSGDRVAQQHTGRDAGGGRPGQGSQRPGGPSSGPGRGAGQGAGRGNGPGAGAGGPDRPGQAGPPSRPQQRPGMGKQRLGGVLKAAGGAMDPSNIVEGGAVGHGSQSFGVMDAAADVAKVLNATRTPRNMPRPQVGTQAAPHAGSTAGGHHRAHGYGGPSQDRGQSQDFERTRAGR